MTEKYIISILKKTIFFYSFLFFSFSLTFAETIYPPEGSLQPTSIHDLQRYSSEKETSFSESWNYFIYADSNSPLGQTQLEIAFSLGGIGSFRKPVIGTHLYISNLKGTNYSVAREYPIKNYTFNQEKQHLSFHQKIWIKGDLPNKHHLYFETTKKGIHYLVDLSFSQIDTGYIWNDGIYKKKKEKRPYMKMSFPIPYAKVEGIIVINNDTSYLNGSANMSHTYLNTGRINNLDFTYRYASPKSKRIGMWIKNKNSKKLLGYAIKKTEKSYELVTNDFKIKDFNKLPPNTFIPSLIQINEQISHKLQLPYSSFSLLSEFSGFKKYAIKKVVGGNLFKFYGIGSFDSDQILYFYFAKNKNF